MKPLVIIPTYNEAENVAHIVGRARRNDVDVLIADDNSPDGTGQLAEELAAADPRVQVMHRVGKEGLGKAYLAAFEWGLERDYTHLVEMDADGSHRPEQLGRLLNRASEEDRPDLVIGSRYVRGGSTVNWPLTRQLLSRGGNLYIRVMLGLPVNDATAGYRVYRREILEAIGLDTVDATGYYFQTEMTRRVAELGGAIAEVPVTFVERELGDSKMDQAVFTESLGRTTRLGLERLLRKLGIRR
ncbi:MAG TPA: polyprenol monophosphomannose synthase [Actinomycetaceae bacterium]|nr:polyprenol monophosphomannose synthase [Actinomycetaceae bacterium]